MERSLASGNVEHGTAARARAPRKSRWPARLDLAQSASGLLLAALAGHRPVPGRVFAAVVIQAACFAAFHLLPERMPQTFVLGLVLGWLTLRCGSILPAVLAHLAHNSVLLGLYAFSADAAAAGQATAATPGLPPAVLGGAVGCLALSAAVVWMTTGSAGMSVRD